MKHLVNILYVSLTLALSNTATAEMDTTRIFKMKTGEELQMQANTEHSCKMASETVTYTYFEATPGNLG